MHNTTPIAKRAVLGVLLAAAIIPAAFTSPGCEQTTWSTTPIRHITLDEPAIRPAELAMSKKAVIFVRVPGAGGAQRGGTDPNWPGGCWQDMAYLAAVPAGTKCNLGAPSVIALDATCAIPREVEDYLRRYKPGAVYCLGNNAGLTGSTTQPAHSLIWPGTHLPAESAGSAAWVLATTFWDSAEQAVLCDEGDYASALLASSLAAKLRAPLLFTGDEGLGVGAMSCIRHLGVKQALFVGDKAGGHAHLLAAAGVEVKKFRGAHEVLAWLGKKDGPLKYLAVASPDDRDDLVIRKISLSAPLLAAGRGGIVAPLDYEVLWKVGLIGEDVKGEAPKGTPASKKTPRMGKIEVGGPPLTYIVTNPKEGRDYTRINIDVNGDGDFEDEGEGPFHAGDVVAPFGDRKYSISLGARLGMKADARITAPVAEDILTDLHQLYKSAGGYPEHLAIVAMPDAIPQAIVPEGDPARMDITSDFPFANADDDLFGEIAVGRVVAENATFATLYASRVITYPDLLDETWMDKAGQARWENTYTEMFENYGFVMAPLHDEHNLGWIEPPAGKKRGKRERGFRQGSPLSSVSAIAHIAHSWWRDIGQTYHRDSQVLLAPVVLETGGCLSTALDRQPDYHTVVTRMLRNGATTYVGNTLPSTATQEQQRIMFWNDVFERKTVGQAQLAASNGQVAVVLEKGQLKGGPNHHMLYLCGLFGDPGFRMHIPSKARVAPARCEADKKGEKVSVFAPAEWWNVKMRVPEDWKKWKDKDLYVIRGAGAWPTRGWVYGEDYDKEETYVWASIRTDRKLKAIRQVQDPPKPLGWTGKYVVDENADGTRTYLWRVRVVDFDQKAGRIISEVDRLDYRLTFE